MSQTAEIDVVRPDEPDFPGDGGRVSARSSDATYVCDSCGAVRSSATDLKIHKEAEHPKQRRGRTATGTDTGTDSGTPTRRTKSEKREIQELKKSILEDLNPFIISQIVVLGVPPGAMDITLQTGKTVRQEIEFGETQADLLARGVVKMRGTGVANTVTSVVVPFLPYAFGLVALIVLVMHGVKLFMLRQQLVTMMRMQALAQQGNSGGTSPQYV